MKRVEHKGKPEHQHELSADCWCEPEVITVHPPEVVSTVKVIDHRFKGNDMLGRQA